MTNIARWSNLKESYDDRIEYMAQFIKPDSSVLDLGAGSLALKNYLPAGCRYQSCDIVSREATTIVCNFNKNEFPPPKRYDYVFCSGLLEYINDLPGFMSQIRNYSDNFIVSYVATKSKGKKRIKKREGLDWVNHYNFIDIVKIFLGNGYRINQVTDFVSQKVFILKAVNKNKGVKMKDLLNVCWIDLKAKFQKRNNA